MSDLLRIINLKDEALVELYLWIDKEIRVLPKKKDGTIDPAGAGLEDNEIDALRHAYVSGAYTMEFGEQTAEVLGRLNELFVKDSKSQAAESENMDLWNNAVGRLYGKKAKTKRELFDILIKAMKQDEMIINLDDKRKYKGEKSIKRRPKSLVITIQETVTGQNIKYFDIDQRIVFSKEDFLTAIKDGKYTSYSIKRVDGKEFPFSKRDRFKFNNLG